MSGKITSLEVQKRNRERVNVYIDDEFAFGLNMLDAAHLQTGQHLSAEEIATLKATDDAAKALDSAVRFLAPRPRSIAEICRRLEKKGFSAPAIDDAIDRLEQLHYVDDLAFARYWVRNREEFNPRGRQALRYELRQKGVASEVIEEALRDISPNDSAYRAAQKKLRTLRQSDPRSREQTLGSYLARRGFSYDVVREVLDRIEEELAAEETRTYDDEE